MTTRLVVSLAMLLSALPAAAAEGDVHLTAGAGVLFPGTVYIEPYDWDTGTGLHVNGGVDYFVANRLVMGAIVQYTSTTLTEEDVGVSCLGLGAALKALVGSTDRLHAKLGLLLMYQRSSVDVDGFDPATGFGAGGLVEVLLPLAPKLAAGGQLGFVSQPSGGNDDGETTWAPLFFLGVGLNFGL